MLKERSSHFLNKLLYLGGVLTGAFSTAFRGHDLVHQA
jgi:hypothetical protein